MKIIFPKFHNFSHFRFPVILLFFFILLSSVDILAATRTATVSGNWNSTTTWGGSSVPTSADDVIIRRGITVTVTANAACNSLDFDMNTYMANGSFVSTLTVNSGFTLTVTNEINYYNPQGNDSEVYISGSGIITALSLLLVTNTSVSNGTHNHIFESTIANLNVSGNVTLYSRRGNNNSRIHNGTYSQPSGTVSAGGTFSTVNNNALVTSTILLGNSSPTLNLGGATPLSLSATGTNVLTFNGTGATVNYNRNGNQTVYNTPYTNLSLSEGGVKTLGNFANTHDIPGNLSIDNATVTAERSLNIGGSVTMDRNYTFNAGTFTHNVGGNWTRNGWGTFNASTGTINFTGSSSSINGTLGTQSFNNVTINKTAGQTLSVTGSTNQLNVSGTFQQTTGNFTAPATMSITGNTTLLSGTFTAGNSLTLVGDFTRNGGTFTPGSGTVFLTGVSKTVGGTTSTTFNNLTIGNNANIFLGIAQFVNGTLNLSNGVLRLGGYHLTLGASAPAITGASYTGSMIVASGTGELRRVISANGSYLFPIGDSTGDSEYSPVTLNFTAGSYAPGAWVGVRVTDAKHPQNTSASNYLTRYWTVSQSGITSYTYNFQGSYPWSDVVGQESLQNAGLYTGSLPWVPFGVLASSTLTATGATAIGDFTGLSIPSISADPTTLSGFSYNLGAGPSASQSSVINGVNLTNNVIVTAPSSYEVSTTSNSGFQSSLTLTQSGGNVNWVTIFVRLKAGLPGGNYSESIQLTSTGATTKTIALSGTVIGPTISTGTISGSPFLQGDAVSVPYTITGTYTAGNIFSAELSSSSGDFTSPVNIGNLSSTAAGTISATIPVNATPGSAYRIRVVSNQPMVNGTNNGVDLTITAPVSYKVNVVSTLGTLTGGYNTLKAAFDKINDGTHQGVIQVKINESVTESASAVLNASGTGAASFTSVVVYPTATAVTVSGSLTAPLIQLNGADNITIDGRVNQTGAASMTLVNNNSTDGARTVEWINSAQSNTLQYCYIKGAGTSLTQGTLNLSTSTAGTGNDGNIIAFNFISGVSSTVRATNAIYSSGTATRENNGNIIRNNSIFDFLRNNTASNGIHIATNSTAFTVNANSFYETTNFTSTAVAEYAVIRINNTSGNDFVVTNNLIGGNAVNAAGTWTKTGSNNLFQAITLNVGTTNNSVQGNTIKGFNYTNTAGNAAWYGIRLVGGSANIGTATGNIIGASTGNGSIVYTAFSSAAVLYGISIETNQLVNVSNNNIGSINTVATSNDNATNFYGVYKAAVAGNVSITNNVIGSTSTTNSINATSLSTNNSQLVYGVYSQGTALNTITGNTISNLTNSSSETGQASKLYGVYVTAGSTVITGNLINYLTTSGVANGANYANVPLAGVSVISKDVAVTHAINDNTIHNLENITSQSTTKFEMYGIYFDGPVAEGSATISRNFIHTYIVPINSSTGSYLHGISLQGGSFIASNNIVFLGNNIQKGLALWGLWTNTPNHAKFYHNTVYLSGVATDGTSNSFAMRVLSCPASLDVRNNILWDGRVNSIGTISHYAIYLNCLTNAIVDYNDYQFAQQFGQLGATTYDTFNQWKTGTSLDANSLTVDPQLVNLGGTLPIDYQTQVQLSGTPIAGITTDFDGVLRDLIAPTMGAWEYFPSPVEIWYGNVFKESYNTLGTAFADINAGVYQGDMIIKFKGNTIEPTSATLNASGTGSANYTRILIYPDRSGITVTGTIAGPLVHLNGAKNVTFDGRVSGTGTPYQFTFTNNSTNNTAGTSVFQFGLSSQQDTIRHTVIRGATTASVGGNVYFASATVGGGNSNNVILNNKITSVGANRPVNSIFSQGSVTQANSGNIIQGNEIYDFLNPGIDSYGVRIVSNSTGFKILNNSFYETTTSTPTVSTIIHRIIYVDNTGTGHEVVGNHIGGNAALSSGSWTKPATNTMAMYAITINAGTAAASSVQGNTIRGFNITNAGSANWYGIYVGSGRVNVGTTTANLIGSSTTNGSITFNNTLSSGNVIGIQINSADSVRVLNNSIAGITAANATSTNATNLYGILQTSGAGSVVITANTVGSATSASSMQTSSASSSSVQRLYGIVAQGTGTITISDNTIVNLHNASSNANTATTGVTNGIWVSGGSKNTVSTNVVRNLSALNANTDYTHLASVSGIALSGTVANRTVSGNTIYNLSNNRSAYEGWLYGIWYDGSDTGTNAVTANFIHSLNAPNASDAGIVGINKMGTVTLANNIINIGNSTTNYYFGIYDESVSGSVSKLYFNSVYVGGSNVSSNNSYALFAAVLGADLDYRNNILVNARSSSISNFAIYYDDVPTVLTVDYNNYYVSGTGGVLGYYNAASRPTINLLRLATGQDDNSLNANPQFVSAGSTTATDYQIGVSLNGITGTGVSVDYGAASRPGTGPTMGAWERNVNKWKGTVSDDWNTAINWTGNTVPDVDASIEFDAVPLRHCVMDQNRSVTNIINAQGTYRVVTNAYKLTVKGELMFTNGAQIDASSAGSTVEFAGQTQQSIPTGSFYNNEIYNLNVNNSTNVILNGTLRLLNVITAPFGRLDAVSQSPTVVYAGVMAQEIVDARYLDNKVHNLTIDDSLGVTVQTDFTVNNNMIINAGKKLTVPTTKSLTVLGSISNLAGVNGLVVKSASGQTNGTLIFFNTQNNPVPATVEMYSKATYDLNMPVNQKYHWQFFGIPLDSVQAAPTFNGSWVRRKVEFGTAIDNHWLPLTDDSILRPFVGYEITHLAPKVLTFKGNLVNRNFSSGQLPITSTALYPGQHLFSNPYTAAIDIRQIDMGSGSDGSVYMYNTGTYGQWDSLKVENGNGPGQYVVVPKNLAGTGGLPRQVPSMGNMLFQFQSGTSDDYVNVSYNAVVMNNSELQRVKSNIDQAPTEEIPSVSTSIQVESSLGSDRMWIFSSQEYTRGFDNGSDGRKMPGSVLNPQIYAIEQNEHYQVNAVDDMNNTVLGFKAGRADEYTLRFRHENSAMRYGRVLLHDLQTRQLIDVTQDGSTYSFTATATDAEQRFRILTRPLGSYSDIESQISVYNASEMVYIENRSDEIGTIYLYDVSGRLLGQQRVNGQGGLATMRVPNQHIVIVKVVTPLETVTESIIIQ